jgi:hypothetical protein
VAVAILASLACAIADANAVPPPTETPPEPEPPALDSVDDYGAGAGVSDAQAPDYDYTIERPPVYEAIEASGMRFYVHRGRDYFPDKVLSSLVVLVPSSSTPAV